MKRVIIGVILIFLLLAGWSLRDTFQGSVAEKPSAGQALRYDEVPAYTGEPSVEVNGGVPAFAKAGEPDFYQRFAELDRLGRCGVAEGCLDQEHMPGGERGSIGMIKPSGWQIAKYDFIENGGYLYNRCHLIGWQLTGINDDERNLITGTRYLNVEGMLPYENRVASYLRRTDHHVLYRITPVFEGKELVCRGVQMEAKSLEDDGEGLAFNVFCYNVQPGIEIDYRTGDNHRAEEMSRNQPSQVDVQKPSKMDYILNTNTRRFHYSDCSSVQDMKDKNKNSYHGTRVELIEQGYQPCGICKP